MQVVLNMLYRERNVHCNGDMCINMNAIDI